MSHSQKGISRIRIRQCIASATRWCTVVLLGMVTPFAAQAQTFTTLYNFPNRQNTAGDSPYAQPVVDESGNIYGTTYHGGGGGYGTVWKLSSRGKLSVLHSFAGPDGAGPTSGVKLDKNGNIFGTTCCGGSGNEGSVFEISSDGTFTTLYHFGSMSGDPLRVIGGVTLDGSHTLYGTSYFGGAFGYGTIWKLSKSSESVLYSFTDGHDGANPAYGSLYRDEAGTLFGVAPTGGSSGCGTLFEINSVGMFSALHSFNCASDGGNPDGNVVESKGNLYGAAESYGASGYGTVWRYNIKSGMFTVLHNFSGTDGASPIGGVACRWGKKAVCAGKLFGTTYEGGASGYGTVWEIDSGGKFRTLHNFANSDGGYPYACPFVGTSGAIYGTTYEGGAYRYGTVWKINFP